MQVSCKYQHDHLLIPIIAVILVAPPQIQQHSQNDTDWKDDVIAQCLYGFIFMTIGWRGTQYLIPVHGCHDKYTRKTRPAAVQKIAPD